MICLFFAPIVIDLTNQSAKLRIENQAQQFLYGELDSFLITGQTSADYTISKNGAIYHIHWQNKEDSLQKEVCVRIEKSVYHTTNEICVNNE